MNQNTKNEKNAAPTTTTTSEEKNAQLEIAKVRKQVRTGVQAGGWRFGDNVAAD